VKEVVDVKMRGEGYGKGELRRVEDPYLVIIAEEGVGGRRIFLNTDLLRTDFLERD